MRTKPPFLAYGLSTKGPRARRWDLISPVLASLHWPPLYFRINFKILLFVNLVSCCWSFKLKHSHKVTKVTKGPSTDSFSLSFRHGWRRGRLSLLYFLLYIWMYSTLVNLVEHKGALWMKLNWIGYCHFSLWYIKSLRLNNVSELVGKELLSLYWDLLHVSNVLQMVRWQFGFSFPWSLLIYQYLTSQLPKTLDSCFPTMQPHPHLYSATQHFQFVICINLHDT